MRDVDDLPYAVQRLQRKRQKASKDEPARREVRKRWNYRCRVCGRRTSVVHEERRRGAGGAVSLVNSYLACDVGDNGACHPLLQNRFIYAVMAAGEDASFDAQEDLVFEMTERIAKVVFDHRTRPAHVRIVEE